MTSIENKSALFEAVWTGLQTAIPLEQLCFPEHIVWLNGAPGAGKGTHTPLLLKRCGITPAPVGISDLLQAPEARKIMDAGLLVGDEEVTTLLFKKILSSVYQKGVMIDGYPRTLPQAECVKAFYDGMVSLHHRYKDTPFAERFPFPHFQVVVLLVDEAVSVARQLHRGQQAVENNQKVAQMGSGTPQDVRKTDLDPERAQKRYRVFCDSTFAALKALEGAFPYHVIDAGGSVEAVEQSIDAALRH